MSIVKILNLKVFMMTEDIHKWTDGRYTLMFDEHTFFVWDNIKEERMTALQVTKKLNEQEATINNQEQKIKILQQEINDTQAILEMQSEKLKGWNNE